MRTDRELLELAAKAAGIKGHFIERMPEDGYPGYTCGIGPALVLWNPLTNDGDALRLAIDLSIQFGNVQEDARGYVEAGDIYIGFEWDMHRPSDRYEATRRAIVRAAAEIGAQVAEPTKGEK